MRKIRIGYLGDGIWAHGAFKKIIEDDSIEIMFVTVRYDYRDSVLMELAQNNNIPVELSSNINSDDYITLVKKYEVDLLVSMSFNQIFKEKILKSVLSNRFTASATTHIAGQLVATHTSGLP